jgi:phosphatidylethanolamine/phosphatidyl-N-methylethanolamine N-methyltransferase
MSADLLTQVSQYVDVTDKSFLLAAGFILFNPTFWNVVGRFEHKTRLIRKAFCGHKLAAVYFFAVVIFSLGIARDLVYHNALSVQPSVAIPEEYQTILKAASVALYVIGQTLVLSAYYRLGIDGTYLGDYFGILKTEKLTGFPFNVSSDPMYLGSTLTFLGHALFNAKPAGVLLSVYVYVVYKLYAEFLEGPFTDYIYSEAAKRAQQTQQKKAKKDN